MPNETDLMQPAAAPDADFASMFALAPVSLWLEDYSALRELLQQWRAEGITDLRSHLSEHPGCIRQGTSSLRVLQVNQRTLQLFAANSQAQLLASLDQVFRDDMHHQVACEWESLWAGELEFFNQTVNYALDGRRLDVQVRGRILPGHERTWSRVLVSLEDITAQKESARQLLSSERYANDLFQHSPVSLWVEDFHAVKLLLDGLRHRGIVDFRTFLRVHPEFVQRCLQEVRVIDVNQQTLRMFNAPSKAALLASMAGILGEEARDSFSEQLQDLWDGKLFQEREVVNHRLSGELLHIHMQFSVLDHHHSDWGLVLLSMVDISARKKAEAYLEYLGKHDVLTQLRNRAFYAEELNRIARKGPWPLSLIAIDLNGLKRVNDEQGHSVGDALLRRMGEVLAKAVDAPACAARIGGDEFMVLLPGMDEHGTVQVQERIHTMVELNNQFYPGQALSLSMGVASCSAGSQVEAAAHRADQQMYANKLRHYQEKELDRRQEGR